MSIIIKLDSHDLTLMQFVDKDAIYNQPRVTITEPGHIENGTYYPAESILLYGAASIVKLYEFLGACIAEANLIEQKEFPFVRALAKVKESEDDGPTESGGENTSSDSTDEIDI